jgi:hypothetical protein
MYRLGVEGGRAEGGTKHVSGVRIGAFSGLDC